MKTKFIDGYLTFCVYALVGWLYEVLWLWFVVPPKHFVNRGVLIGPFLPIYGFGMLILLYCLKKFISKKHELQNPLFMVVSTFIVTTLIFTTVIQCTVPKIYNVLEYLKSYGLGLLLANIIVLAIIYTIVSKTNNKKIKQFDTTIIIVFLFVWLITTTLEYISHFVIDKGFHTILWDYTKDFLNINGRVTWGASRNFAIGGTFLLYTIQPIVDKLLNRMKDKQKLIAVLIIGIPMLLDFILHVILKII
jgi:uncharacterized membrane protein